VIVPIKYERVSLEELSPRSSFGMDREERSVFTVIDKNKKCGVYSLDGKQLVATMYDDIHCDKSGRMDNGLYKFVVSQDNLFGVINSNGRVEVPFEYRFPSKGCGCYTFQEDGVSRLEIADNNGKEAYFNIFEKNIVASEEDVLSIKQYESGLRKVTEKNKSKTKTVTKTVSKYSEDEVAGTPTDQTFCGILKDGTVVKFILHDSYYENDSNDENLHIVPALPYKRDGKWWATQIDGNKREFSYKEFDKISVVNVKIRLLLSIARGCEERFRSGAAGACEDFARDSRGRWRRNGE
jgi:hypothetical protein